MSHRSDRVADLIRAELADLLLRRMGDPRARQASISHVRVTPDFSRANISVTVFGDETQRDETVTALQRARGFLRSELARRIRLRTTPELVFELDRNPEHSQRIAELLEKLNADDQPT